MFHSYFAYCYITRWHTKLQTWTSSTFFTSGSLPHPFPCWDPVDALSAIGQNPQINLRQPNATETPTRNKTPLGWRNWTRKFEISCNIYQTDSKNMRCSPCSGTEKKVMNMSTQFLDVSGTWWPYRWEKRHLPLEERRALDRDPKMTKDG